MKKKQSLMSKLIFLCLITTSITSTFTLSRYKSTVAGTNSARVAAFVVQAEGNGSDNIGIDCNEDNLTTNYDIIITNEQNGVVSEVAMKYDIIVNFSSPLPNEMTISLPIDGESKTYNGGQTQYIFENVGQFIAGSKETKTHTLLFTCSNNIKDNFSCNMQLSINTEQID